MYRPEPSFLDQTSDHGAGDRFRHRPARGRAMGGAEFAVAFAEDALGSGDENTVCAGRASKESIERAGKFGGRGRGCVNRITKRPWAAGLASSAGKRQRIEFQIRIRAEDDPAIAGPSNRGASDGPVEFGVVPRDDNAAVGIVQLDNDVSAALGGRELCLSIRRGPEPEPAWRNRRPPAEMPLRRGAIEPADIAHIGETLGREVNGALA